MMANKGYAGRYVIGNWKCNKTYSQAREWLDHFLMKFEPDANLRVVVAPAMVCLSQLADYLQNRDSAGIELAAQDISPFPAGGYTGAVAADMLKNVAAYAITGHLERRRYFHETNQDVTNKVSEAADAGICPIVCVDTSFAMSQLTALSDIDSEQLIVAYCPVDAMSYRAPEPEEKVAQAVEFISQICPGRPIIYGGAVNGANARDYLGIPGISGLFVGSASLDPDDFIQVCRAVRE